MYVFCFTLPPSEEGPGMEAAKKLYTPPMNTRALQHLVVITYCVVTLSGLMYTLFRVHLPGVPLILSRFSYGMMAPFQHYLTYNEELIAEGRLEGGEWMRIDLDSYLPFVRGERAMRSYLVSFRVRGEEVWPQKYREFADKIQMLEEGDGRVWESVRLSFERWPMSPAGYSYLRHPPFTQIYPQSQIP